ncbi:MAG TPA: acyltransferase family protein [Paludibacter sp.]|nr:acyltransferase family protein [Paludibacter sp.]
MPSTNNIQWLNTLRTLATLGVIVIHVTTPVLKMMYGRNMEYWWIGNAIDSCVRYIIAMFLMLSGATMLDKDYKLAEFYKKRFMRVLLPFLFWLAAYWIYRWSILPPKQQPHGFQPITRWAIDLFNKEGVSKHFWYIYMILVLYLFVPLLGKIVRNMKPHVLVSVLAGWVVINQLQVIGLIRLPEFYIQKSFSYFMYSGYMVLGYYLYKFITPTEKFRFIAAVVFMSTVLVSALSTYFLSSRAHKLDTTMYGSLTLNTMLQASALFLLAKNTTIKNRVLRWLNELVSDHSYGIYLVHVMVISILFNHKIFWTMAYPLVSLPVIVLLTVGISFGIIFLLRKIPMGKYVSG